jgi:hypothetical protein
VNEFINLHPERQHLKLLFVRESLGWYQFGTKRCNIKSENGFLLVIANGGTCTIDEFIDQNLGLEVTRLNANPYRRGSASGVSISGFTAANKK